MKISISLSEEMYERVQQEGSVNGQKVSQFIQMCIEHEFNTIDAQRAIVDLCGVDTEQIYKALEQLPQLNENLKALVDANNQKSSNES